MYGVAGRDSLRRLVESGWVPLGPLSRPAPNGEKRLVPHSYIGALGGCGTVLTPSSHDANLLRKGGNTHVTVFTTWLSAVLRKEEGQGLAEYALILALIAVIAIAALVFLGTQISSILSNIGANI